MCREIVAHLMLNNYELILELSDILWLFDGFVKCVGKIWVVQKKKQNWCWPKWSSRPTSRTVKFVTVRGWANERGPELGLEKMKSKNSSEDHGGLYGPLLLPRTVVPTVKLNQYKSKKELKESLKTKWRPRVTSWAVVLTTERGVSRGTFSSDQVWRPTLGKIQGKTTEGFTVHESLDGS